MSVNKLNYNTAHKIDVCLKRIFDILFSLILLIVFSPLVILISVIIKFNSKGSVFYRGVRSGLNGKPFIIFKFRTMVQDAEICGGPSTAHNDPRLTSVGKFLRKYKLDELPQLFNVFVGNMSFVGPRPQVERYTRLYKGEENIILSVRPGLTDYSSIVFIHLDKLLGDENVDEKYLSEIEPEKNALRIKYVKERNLWIDSKIIYNTMIRLFNVRTLWNT